MSRWRVPLLVFCAAAAAPVAAVLLHLAPPEPGRTNHGELLEPSPMPAAVTAPDGTTVPTEDLRGKWLLIQTAATACDEQCRRRLCLMRQIRLNQKEGTRRIARVWLVPDGGAPPDGVTADADCGLALGEVAQGRAPVDVSSGVVRLRMDDALKRWLPEHDMGHIYLADPEGRLVMRYRETSDIYKINTDIKKLLKFSGR